MNMKTITKIFGAASLALAAVALFSCTNEIDYSAGEPDVDGCYRVYFPEQDTDISVDPDDDATLTIYVMRDDSASDEAITVPYELTDTSSTGVFKVEDEIVFAAGSYETSFTVSFAEAEIGTSYSCAIDITDPQYASRYSTLASGIDVTAIRDRWKDMDDDGSYATFSDECWFDYSYQVHIQQNDIDATRYRLEWPYAEGLYYEYGYSLDEAYGGDQYLTLKVMSAGAEPGLGEVATTKNGLVYWDVYNMGLYNSTYSSYTVLYHPSDYSSSFNDETYYTHSYVKEYKKDGTPSTIQLAPLYYLPSYGGGYNYSTYDDVIVIIFPGAADYTLSITAGETDNGYVPLSFEVGSDVTAVKYQIYEGALGSSSASSRAEGIIDGSEESSDLDLDSPDISVSLDGGTGIYTIVAVTFDEDNESETTASLQFYYVAAGDDMPVTIAVGMNSTSRYSSTSKYCTYTADNTLKFNIVGEDILDLKYEIIPTEDYEGDESAYQAELKADDDAYVSSDVVDAVNSETGYAAWQTYFRGGVDYTLLVWASNGYQSAFVTASAATTDTYTPALDDLLGVYSVQETSAYGPDYDDVEEWIIEASDSSDFNIMITEFDGWPCLTPIYGNFDESTGSFSFESDQRFYPAYGNTYDFWFMTDSGDPMTFELLNEGMFIADSDIFGVYLCDATLDEEDEDYWWDFNNAYYYVAAERTANVEASASASAAKLSSVNSTATLAPMKANFSAQKAYHYLGTHATDDREVKIATYTVRAGSTTLKRSAILSKTKPESLDR